MQQPLTTPSPDECAEILAEAEARMREAVRAWLALVSHVEGRKAARRLALSLSHAIGDLID